jgi:hypothetical protein
VHCNSELQSLDGADQQAAKQRMETPESDFASHEAPFSKVEVEDSPNPLSMGMFHRSRKILHLTP